MLQAPQTKKTYKLSNITYFGPSKTIEKFYVEKFNLHPNTKTYSKMILNSCLFRTSTKLNQRSCNYYAQLANEKFVKIKHFFVDVTNSTEITICQVISVTSNKYSEIVKNVTYISNEEICVKTHDISKICVYVETNAKHYIIPVPNIYFY